VSRGRNKSYLSGYVSSLLSHPPFASHEYGPSQFGKGGINCTD
jgi:hypothetical protein